MDDRAADRGEVPDKEFCELKPQQQAALAEYTRTGNKAAAARSSGMSPAGVTSLVDAPNSQKLITEFLPGDTMQRAATVLREGLDIEDPADVIGSQRERRQTVMDIARVTGQTGPDIAIGIGVGTSIDQAEKAAVLISRYQHLSEGRQDNNGLGSVVRDLAEDDKESVNANQESS